MVRLVILLSSAAILCGVRDIHAIQQNRTLVRSSLAEGNRPPQSKGRTSAEQPFSFRSVTDVLWWLPEDTETVSVVRGPFKAPAAMSDLPEDISPAEATALVLTAAQLGPLQTLLRGRFYKYLAGRSISVCVEGSRRVRAPVSLGPTRYEGCHIIILEQELGPARRALIGDMASRAKHIHTITGRQVMVFEEKLESDVWQISVTVAAPNVLLCATDAQFLTQVINRMTQKGGIRALPDDLPEWKHVNMSARFWSVRHYDRNSASQDPTSPLSGEERAANWPDKEAIGIVFEFDPERMANPRVKYLSTNKNALRLFSGANTMATEGFKPEFRQIVPGEIEMVTKLDNSQMVSVFYLVVFAMFGHALFF